MNHPALRSPAAVRFSLAIAVFALLGNGCLSLPTFSGPDSGRAAMPILDQAVTETTITLTTDSTWSPAAVRVPVGTTVRWVNQSKAFMGIHPGTESPPVVPTHPEPHSDLVAPGGVYEYTFQEAGVYHFNHNFEAFGLVYVQE